ncbi:ATP-dependent RNA helicase DBP2 [Hondaea fermentalgiana]|uniref:RNA helicase n=1 Tax=Hondaea fermentalgiana TaxID=2315210 RepID=A0A2R5GHR8_9STRA|nr:ATP-dependent RNA helicase DBP2 [Hondaea fermentalgiana]|eukprot:GBG30135.1 ATP-dependent RNA helicase DBP2 [Hondaea fermentalgiana]
MDAKKAGAGKKPRGHKRGREARATATARKVDSEREEAGEAAEEQEMVKPVREIDDERLPECFGASFRNSRGALKQPTEVQSVAWPALLAQRDVLGVAPTGSGKSIAYVLPALAHVLEKQRLAKAEKRSCSAANSPSVVTLLPTRELAQQACATAHRFCKPYMVNCLAAYGGKDRAEQVERLRSENVEILFATPGRALDLVRAEDLSLESTTFFVLDECDRMLDMGFEPQLREFASALRKDGHETQNVLLSATFPAKLQRILKDLALLARDPLRFRVNPGGAVVPFGDGSDGALEADETELSLQAASAEQTAAAAQGIASSITQIVQVCAEHKKPMKLAKFLDKVDAEDREQNRTRNPSSILIFCTKIKTVKFVESFLRKEQGPASGKQPSQSQQHQQQRSSGKSFQRSAGKQKQQQQAGKRRCVALHGNLSQDERERALRDFRAGKARILVATDVAGRGIDIKGLPFVVNYDFPGSLEVYVHRVGRTGRQDRPGVAYSFFTRNMAPLAPSLIELLKASQQKVDPFLQRLVDQGEDDPDLKKIRERQQKRRKKNETDEKAKKDK